MSETHDVAITQLINNEVFLSLIPGWGLSVWRSVQRHASGVSLVGCSKLPIGLSVSMRGCLSVSPVMNW